VLFARDLWQLTPIISVFPYDILRLRSRHLFLVATGFDWIPIAWGEVEFRILFWPGRLVMSTDINIRGKRSYEWFRPFPFPYVRLSNIVIPLYGLRYMTRISVSPRAPSYIYRWCDSPRILRRLLGFYMFCLYIRISDNWSIWLLFLPLGNGRMFWFLPRI
jgi:hypothetical protein